MAEAIAELDEQDAWIDLLYTRFKIEVAQERQPALFRALENYAVTQNDTRPVSYTHLTLPTTPYV